MQLKHNFFKIIQHILTILIPYELQNVLIVNAKHEKKIFFLDKFVS